MARILRGMTSLNSLSLSMPLYSSNYHSIGLWNDKCFMALAESLNSLPHLRSLEVITGKGKTIHKDK